MNKIYLFFMVLVFFYSCKPSEKKEEISNQEVVSTQNYHKIGSDLDQDGVTDSIFFDKEGKIIISPQNSKLNAYLDSSFESISWVDTVYLSSESVVYYTTYDDNQEVKGHDSVTNFYSPSLNLYSKEEGGGVLIWKDNGFKWYPKTD